MHFANHDFIWFTIGFPLSLQYGSWSFFVTMSCFFHFCHSPRHLRSLQALGPPSWNVAVGSASKPQNWQLCNQAGHFAWRFFRSFFLTNLLPTKMIKTQKCVIQTNKLHFIYFVSQILLMWCASLTSKIYPDLSCATLSSTQPRLRYSCNDLRSLIRKKIVSNLAKARQAVETTVFRNLNYVNG